MLLFIEIRENIFFYSIDKLINLFILEQEFNVLDFFVDI